MRFVLHIYCLCIVLITSASQVNARDISSTFVRAIQTNDWTSALSQSSRGTAVYSYAQWRKLLDKKSDPSLEELADFIKQHPDWPNLNQLIQRAEKRLFQENKRNDFARRWLSKHPPISGYGMLAYARLVPDTNLVRRAWIQGDFERHDAMQIRSEFHKSLTPNTHRARAERLLREGKTHSATRLIDDVSQPYAKLLRARIALQNKARNPGNLINAVPASLIKDDGLLAERVIWRHNKGLASGARELLIQMSPRSAYAQKLWRIRASYARDAIEAGAYDQAMELLTSAGTQLSGAEKADALWMKGWLDYHFRSKPNEAHETFNQLFHATKYPVSKARGAFWAARAAERSGKKEVAHRWYERAAHYPTAFYGQLAQAAIRPGKPLSLPPEPKVDGAAKARYAKHPLMHLAIRFSRAGLEGEAMSLAHHLVSKAQTAGQFAALMAIIEDANMPHLQVRIAKLALRKHIMLRAGWPVVTLPKDAPLAAELALAITRQESEFNARAISRANARGLMQLLPSTARKVAKKTKVSYSLEALFDPRVNMRLGSQYLQDLIDGFNGNYILAIAGYNAGPGRSRQWIERFGWPGKELEQTLKFIELIPFSETRNYVQRVLEHAQTYRAIMSPSAPLQIKEDLLR